MQQFCQYFILENNKYIKSERIKFKLIYNIKNKK